MSQSEKIRHVFVYGILRKGGSANYVMEKYAEYVGRASAPGVLYRVGSFPGARLEEGRGAIVGDLYEVECACQMEELLKHLDMIEGYDRHDPERSMYIRKVVEVEDGSDRENLSETAYMYEWNGDISRTPEIKSGDFIEHVAQRRGYA